MNDNLRKAVERLNQEDVTCVLCKGSKLYTSTERGVKPLLEWLDQGVDVKGFCAADKVVGKGAAFLYVRLGAEAVYAHVMSESALSVCTGHGIEAEYGTLVKGIINRAGTGPCPMEEAVRDIEEPKQAEAAIRNKLRQMHSASQ